MENEQNAVDEQTEEIGAAFYADQLNAVKASMQKEIDRLRSDNKQLFEKATKTAAPAAEKKPEERKASDILPELKAARDNLSFTKKALEWRRAVIRELGSDPMAAKPEDSESAERVAAVLQDLAESSESSAVFTARLGNMLRDPLFARR